MIGSLGGGVDLDELVLSLRQQCPGHKVGELYGVRLVMVHVEYSLPRVCDWRLAAVDCAGLVRRSFFRYWFLGTTSVRMASARSTADAYKCSRDVEDLAGGRLCRV